VISLIKCNLFNGNIDSEIFFHMIS
jgi:hypothetical protein